MTDKYKVITLLSGEKHIAEFNARRNRWIILGGAGLDCSPEQVVKIEGAMQ